MIFWQGSGEGSTGKLHLCQCCLAWSYTPRAMLDLRLVTAQAPSTLQPRHGCIPPTADGWSRAAIPPTPTIPCFPHLTSQQGPERAALTGSIQLSSKKLQFCEQSSAVPLVLVRRGLCPPTPPFIPAPAGPGRNPPPSAPAPGRGTALQGEKGQRQHYCWVPAAVVSYRYSQGPHGANVQHH